jgi:hypothetical protein
MFTISGTIYRKDSKERVAGALVKLRNGSTVVAVASNEDGDYSTNVDAGTWKINVFNEDSFPAATIDVDVMADKKGVDFSLFKLNGQADEKAGRIFFWILLGLLGLLVVAYLLMHLVGQGFKPQSFSFWMDSPLKYVEIMMWGIAGIFVNKIIYISLYLRFQRFYKEGVVMHIAQLVVTPLLVLVATLLFSLITLNVTLAGNAVTLDLSKPELLIAFAFILGTSPWPLWGFIENTGKKFTDIKD